ncbi:MAG: gene transfer agent family protein [Kiloniellales bacterium]
MANKERGEVTLELGGEKYVLRPEFGVIAEIEDELDTDMFRFGMKAEQFKFRVKELAHALKVVLEANGYQAEEKRLAKAIAREGMAAVVLPLVAFVHAYVWGGGHEKKDPAPEAAAAATEDAAPSPPTSSPNA